LVLFVRGERLGWFRCGSIELRGSDELVFVVIVVIVVVVAVIMVVVESVASFYYSRSSSLLDR
jgi:hypothetical protein